MLIETKPKGIDVASQVNKVSVEEKICEMSPPGSADRAPVALKRNAG